MAAEGVVIFVTTTQSQGQVITHAPFVFGKQGPDLAVERFWSDTILGLNVPPLGADRGDVAVANGGNELGVEDQVGGFQLPIIADDDTWILVVRGAYPIARNGTPQGFGDVAGQGVAPLAEPEPGFVAQHDLVALELQFVLVAADVIRVQGRATGDGVAPGATIKSAQLAVVVVVGLDAALEIDKKAVLIAGGEIQTCTDGEVLTLDRGGTALADVAAITEGQIGGFAIIEAAPQGQADQIFHQRTAGIQVDPAALAIVAVFLEDMINTGSRAPFVGYLLGDDIDHTTDGVRTVEGGHRAADHLDALNGRHGGMKLVLVSPKPLGVTSPPGFWRRPSIRIRVYSLGMPRRLILDR